MKQIHTFCKRYELVCSRDGVGIDYAVTIEAEREPDFWDCCTIAAKHGCDFFTLEEV